MGFKSWKFWYWYWFRYRFRYGIRAGFDQFVNRLDWNLHVS